MPAGRGSRKPDEGPRKWKRAYIDRVVELADSVILSLEPKMRWMWGEALFGYALAMLDEHLATNRYTEFLTGFCDHHISHPPRIDQIDRTTPALISYYIQKKTGREEHGALTERVVEYYRVRSGSVEDCLDHLGSSFIGRIYPRAIWVDSMMMSTLFLSLYAKEDHDDGLRGMVSAQPMIMARYLMDPKDKLWYHSYRINGGTHYPKSKLYWGRGNGWVICALPMILDNLMDEEEKYNIASIFRETSSALRSYQREDGSFGTILNRPSYREFSATSLIACGWLRGVRLGILDESYLIPSLRAYRLVVDSLVRERGKVYMPEISAATIPLPFFPYLGYRLIPRRRNLLHGIAALIFASIEYDELMDKA